MKRMPPCTAFANISETNKIQEGGLLGLLFSWFVSFCFNETEVKTRKGGVYWKKRLSQASLAACTQSHLLRIYLAVDPPPARPTYLLACPPTSTDLDRPRHARTFAMRLQSYVGTYVQIHVGIRSRRLSTRFRTHVCTHEWPKI